MIYSYVMRRPHRGMAAMSQSIILQWAVQSGGHCTACVRQQKAVSRVKSDAMQTI